MIDILKWFATAMTVSAAFITAANLGARVTGYGFAVFLVGSIAWLAAGILAGDSALTWTNAMLSLLNLFGIWRWLGRESQVEKGGCNAARTSANALEPTLFPVSLLHSAKMRSGQDDLGQCVDAMAGSDGGRIRYVVVSDGGVAGVGETLRRLDWSDVGVDGTVLRTNLSRSEFESRETIARDEWPAR